MTGATMSDGTPAVSDGRVYVGNETADRVIAYDLPTGASSGPGPSPSAAGRTASRPRPTARCSSARTTASSPATARPARPVELPQPATLAGPAATPPRRAAASGKTSSTWASRVARSTALNAGTGAVIWSGCCLASSTAVASFAPAVSGDTLFVGANSGRFYALDARTGARCGARHRHLGGRRAGGQRQHRRGRCVGRQPVRLRGEGVEPEAVASELDRSGRPQVGGRDHPLRRPAARGGWRRSGHRRGRAREHHLGRQTSSSSESSRHSNDPAANATTPAARITAADSIRIGSG